MQEVQEEEWVEPKKYIPKLVEEAKNIKNINIYVGAALLLSGFLSISFAGIRILPQLSFFVFCLVLIPSIYFVLNKLEWLKNKRAFLWAIPIIIISSFNAVFYISLFHYLNIIAVLILFAFIFWGAVHGHSYKFETLYFWNNILNIVFPSKISKKVMSSVYIKRLNSEKNDTIKRVLIGLLLVLPVALVILLLLFSADIVFFELVFNRRPDSPLNFNILWNIAVWFLAFRYFIGYIYNVKYKSTYIKKFSPYEIDNVISFTFLLVLNIIFLAFCYVQFAFLFAGNINTLPPGVIYAYYARSGFFQLLFVTIINFTVLIVSIKCFKEISNLIKFMLLFLGIFTGVLIASSFYRMNMYMNVFGFSPLRMMVITFLVMESIFLIATIYRIYFEKFNIIRFYVVSGMVFFIIANVTTTSYFSSRMNFNLHFSSSREYTFDLQSHFINPDSIGILERLYPHVGAVERRQIRQHIFRFRRAYLIEPWQNHSLLKRIGLGLR